MAKSAQPINTLSINSWKYAVAWLRPNGVRFNCHFPMGTTNADLALNSLVSPMW